jgi:aminopeptidase-like protein
MKITTPEKIIKRNETAGEMFRLVAELYPICRSITGDGVRKTLNMLREYIPLEINEVATGTRVFDWTIPREWNINDAYIRNTKGEKIVDFNKSNLHVMNYSVPIRREVSLEELRDHIFTVPDHPDRIPYRTSYYNENWGFCLSHNQFMKLTDKEYEVVIDSSLKDGYLTYGESFIEGESKEEVLISSHICHPSLCNDNLSGIAVSVFLAKNLKQFSLKYSYRFLFIPATIGAITWLFFHESDVSKIRHGLVAACLGDPGKFTYKKSRQGDAEIDRAVTHVLKTSGQDYEILDFTPFGYDERQYCSPGFNLPVGCFMRTPHGRYPEYHTSADNLEFVRAECLEESLSKYLAVVYILENNKKYLNLNPKGEPQLGRRELYQKVGGNGNSKVNQAAMLWVLNLSDGNNSLLSISARSGIDFGLIKNAADVLIEHRLLEECPGSRVDHAQ